MKARIQNHMNEHDAAEEDLKHFPQGFLKVVDLTNQQYELLLLVDELKKIIEEHCITFSMNFLTNQMISKDKLFFTSSCLQQILGYTF